MATEMTSAPNLWSSECFECWKDLESCLCGYCCGTCWHYGMIVNEQEGGGMLRPCLLYCCVSMIGCPCLVAANTRTALRTKYGLVEAPLTDLLMHFPCCSMCSVCQEYREIRTHGGLPGGIVAGLTSVSAEAKAEAVKQANVLKAKAKESKDNKKPVVADAAPAPIEASPAAPVAVEAIASMPIDPTPSPEVAAVAATAVAAPTEVAVAPK